MLSYNFHKWDLMIIIFSIDPKHGITNVLNLGSLITFTIPVFVGNYLNSQDEGR